MSDFNLFSSKTDIKKLLFTTEKFKFNEQGSNDSWQDLPGVTPTSAIASFLHNQTLETSSISNNRNDTGWETVDDYSMHRSKSTSHGRLDRRGHWLLLTPPPLILPNANQATTNNEPFFPDSCESLTVSVDLHVPTDELMTDIDSPNSLRWRQKTSRYCACDLSEGIFASKISEQKRRTSECIFPHPRCIKPNHGKVANQFDEELVQEQLRYNGILEISSIRNQGWPVRFTFEEFLKRFFASLSSHPFHFLPSSDINFLFIHKLLPFE